MIQFIKNCFHYTSNEQILFSNKCKIFVIQARERKDPVIPSCGYVKHGRELVTKHDLNISGRKNAERIMNLPPGINTGDGGGFDMQISNKVCTLLCIH